MGIVIVKINFSSALNFAIFVSATTAPMVHQASIARDTHSTRIGRPARTLASKCEVREMKVSVPYPKHTRFLDMKKTRTGKKKRRYEPIYNNYVYGYIKPDIYRMMMAAIPKQMIKIIEMDIKTFRYK